MSMTDPSPPMKPQDTVIYLLGELKGQMGAVQASVAASAQSQALVNAENKSEHEEFRKTLAAHADDITAIKTAQPIKVSPWSKAAVIIALPAAAVALIGFIVVYLQPH